MPSCKIQDRNVVPLLSRLSRKIALPQCYLLAKQSKIPNCLIGYRGRVVILSIVNKFSLYYERKGFHYSLLVSPCFWTGKYI